MLGGNKRRESEREALSSEEVFWSLRRRRKRVSVARERAMAAARKADEREMRRMWRRWKEGEGEWGMSREEMLAGKVGSVEGGGGGGGGEGNEGKKGF